MQKEQDFDEFLGGILLEMDVYAEGPELTQQDLETIEVHAESDEKCPHCLSRYPGVHGYIGASERNYLTDEWVLGAATLLGWDRAKLAEWCVSRDGRWAIESNPRSGPEMYRAMEDFVEAR